MDSLRTAMAELPVIGTFLKLPRPEVVEILAITGFDFLICDTEHGQLDERDVRDVVLAGRAAGIPIVVRVPSIDAGAINRMLEAGAAGIQLSGVTGAAQVAELSSVTRYPPDGTRGVSTAQPAAGYGTTPLTDYLAASNAEIVRIGQLESGSYTDPLDDLVAGLDIAFIGVMDLSVDLGVPGQIDAPVVQQVIADISAATSRTGTALGIFAPSAAAAVDAIRAGCRYIALGSDLALLTGAARDALADLRAPEVAHG